MLLKNVYQWDIYTQEDLETFRKESGEIHESAARTIYRTDPESNPGQRKEELPPVDNSLRKTRWTSAQRAKQAKRKKPEKPSPPPVQEQEVDEIPEEFPGREGFLDRLDRDLEHRRQHGKSAGYEGYGIVVKAVVERRDGKNVRAEFVETEGILLAHLPDPNQGRILSLAGSIEDPDGNIRKDKDLPREQFVKKFSRENRWFAGNTVDLLIRTDLDRQARWLLEWLLESHRGDDFPEENYEKMQRDWLAEQLQEQSAKL